MLYIIFKDIFSIFSIVSWKSKYPDTWPQGLSLDEVYVSLLRICQPAALLPRGVSQHCGVFSVAYLKIS